MGSSGAWHRFGLTASPFETVPAAMPFTDGPFRQPFARLTAAIDDRASLILLTGPVGSGRTTLATAAIAASHRADAAAWLPAAAAAEPAALMHWLLARFGDGTAAADRLAPGRRILQTIASPAGARAAPLIVVDDLEAVPAAAFEALLELLAAAAGQTPPLSALLIAAPELAIEVAKAAAAALPTARIAEVAPPALGIEGTAAYITHRLNTAGYRGTPPFTDDALIRIANLSRGLPLRINRLCEACFDGASPATLPLGSDVVAAALAASLPTADDGLGPVPPPRAAAPVAKPAADDDAQEHARLERLAGRVNAAMRRSFKTRVAERATTGKAITAEVPRHAQLPPPPSPPAATSRADTPRAETSRAETSRAETSRAETSRAETSRAESSRAATPPSPPAPAVPSEDLPQRRRPVFALVTVLLIAAAGAALGWLTIGDGRVMLTGPVPGRSPPPAAVTETPPQAVAEPMAAPSAPVAAAPETKTAVPIETPVATPPETPPDSPPDTAMKTLAAATPPVEEPPQDAAQLMARGERLMRQADIAAAQLFFRMAAEQGSAAGALALAASFDPLVLRDTGVRGARANPGEALAWYRRAAELGEAVAEARRDRLIAYLRTAAASGDPAARDTLDRQR